MREPFGIKPSSFDRRAICLTNKLYRHFEIVEKVICIYDF